ncbi:uncharacterized protein LOC129915584 [Episyrphus balteatus]|uniref:uncharacterized protein LOC129915584 n=1 Tax=Episyrphus balteatus TaxID=286459 RepID=UPI002484D960|nr:uncharacterized protein LOC129915584 [Episyrphus balteatus]
MKNEQVVVDYWKMFKTSGLFLLLACSGYVLIKMVQAVFWLPHYLEKNQRKLEDLASTYALTLKDKPIQETPEKASIDEEESKPKEQEVAEEIKKDK